MVDTDNYSLSLENTRLREQIQDLEEELENLRNSEQALRAITSSAQDAIIMRDDTGTISFWNKAAERLFGYKADEVLGRKLPMLLDTPKETGEKSLFQHAQSSFSRGNAISMNALRKDGTTLPVELSMSSVHLKGNWHFISILRDATYRLEAEAALRAAKDQAEDISRMKSDFLASVSHELRTPLTSIRGFIQVIHKRLETTIFTSVPPGNPRTEKAILQVRNNLGILASETQRITDMINDVLALSQLEGERTAWNMAPVDLNELVLRTMEASRSQFEEKGLDVDIRLDPDLPDVVCDRKRIAQVINNLTSNALKFTDSGTVTFMTKKEEDSVLAGILDTGVGISPEEQNHVFEKFRQLGGSLTDKPKGTGLGLALCREIIAHHLGVIWVESTVGKGSAFYFRLPLS